MPALFDRSWTLDATALQSTTSANDHSITVICAWPLSGQYGVGSRILYYILVAACVLARKSEWLRNACLAAALIFPAVAAFHGITLAALHVDGAVDLDIYGAFQFCSIGILAVPVTTRLSQTYFYDPGRNIIFLWTGLVLAGLLSLTVEFHRSNPVPCMLGDGDVHFPYGDTPCGLDYCVEGSSGPRSPMRTSATSEIWVVPAPSSLTFSAATLLAAACCIPAILYLISTWIKILELNWKSRFGTGDLQERIEGTNGATVGGMLGVNAVVGRFLSVLEVLLFGAAVVAILVVGEMNFFSEPMMWDTEYLQSIGQWAPLVGATMAVLGSLYHLLIADVQGEGGDGITRPIATSCCCKCVHHAQYPPLHRSPSMLGAASTHSGSSSNVSSSRRQQPLRTCLGLGVVSVPDLAHSNSSMLLHRCSTATGEEDDPDATAAIAELEKLVLRRTRTTSGGGGGDAASRRRVAEALNSMANYLGTAAHDRFDGSDFRHGKAVEFPEIPGEAARNERLVHIREAYNPPREADGSLTPELGPQQQRSRSRSRASSFNGPFASGAIIMAPELALGGLSRQASVDDDVRHRPQGSVANESRSSSANNNNKNRSNTLPTHKSPRSSIEDLDGHCLSRGRQKRSNTLEVPVLQYQARNSSVIKSITTAGLAGVPAARATNTPAIVVSSGDGDILS